MNVVKFQGTEGRPMKSTDNRKGKGMPRYEILLNNKRFKWDEMPFEAVIADALTSTTQEDVEYAKSIPDVTH